jgi:hypothetical protein
MAHRSDDHLAIEAEIDRVRSGKQRIMKSATAISRQTTCKQSETKLVGCPSWIHIELCAAHPNPLFGGFWRISGSCASPPRWQGSFRGGRVSGGAAPLDFGLYGKQITLMSGHPLIAAMLLHHSIG